MEAVGSVGRRRPRGRGHAHSIMLVALVLMLSGIFVACVLVKTNDTVHDTAKEALATVEYPISYSDEIAAAAKRNEVNPYWICAVIEAESEWDADATSSAGAVGLMQIMPQTAEQLVEWGLVDGEAYPIENLSDPAVNIEYGTAQLRYLVERYHEMEPAIAAYNAGTANVDAWLENGDDIRDVIEFPETRSYLLSVVWNEEQYENLYPDVFSGWDTM